MKFLGKDSKYASLIDMCLLLLLATSIGLIFEEFGFLKANSMLVYILAIVAVAIRTEGYLYTMLTAVLTVILFNFFFVEPAFSLVGDPKYLVTFIIIICVAFIVATLTNNIRKVEAEKVRLEETAKREAFQANILRAISHDLRTPLAGISGNANILLSHGDELSPELKQKIYSAIEEDSDWLNELVENLLSISRMSSVGDLDTGQAEIVMDLIEEALKHVDRNKDKYTIKLHHNEDNELLMVKADARLIVQVIINIVNNAIKYTEEGSHIDIFVEQIGKAVEVKIQDDGAGLSDESIDRVFDKFYTEGKVRSDSRRGLGLGLYLCKAIVEAHGGSISAGNVEPHGACFAFRLPVAELNINE